MTAMHLLAYIDAGTGSYILAAIASGVAGFWFFLRSGMAKLKRKLKGLPPPDYSHEDTDDSADKSEVEVESSEVQER